MLRKYLRLVLLIGCICFLVLYMFVSRQKTIPENLLKKHVDDTLFSQNEYIGLCFDSLLAWQSGNTNSFLRIIQSEKYDPHLRNAIEIAIKRGQNYEIPKKINLCINYWIIVEAGHSRNYEWPHQEADREDWGLLAKIFVNRQKYPCSTGDINTDATIKRILEKTQR
ncbi:MAG: hypothetical protein PHO37_18550 [Kiritimatiellae bacterium]|nr:hypothetical protein [Kiritimatiellia bacterium]